MEEEKIRYEALPKPVLEDLKDVVPNTESFEDGSRAYALIKCLKLKVGDVVREKSGEFYTINPRMELRGESPEHYAMTIENLKKILTKDEIKAISYAISHKTKNTDKLYHQIEKRTDRFYRKGEIMKSVDPGTKEILEFFKNNNHTGLNNTIYHLLSQGSEKWLMCYKCAWRGEPIPNIQEWQEENDGEYRVLTDGEADDAADDYLDEYQWKEAVRADMTTSSYDDWKEYVISEDGRGSLLNGYDGTEDSEDVEGTTYYIYRTN